MNYKTNFKNVFIFKEIIMGVINKYSELFVLLAKGYHGAELGKKVTQKMFYFFERNGINLNLRYGIHYYGPYSSKLDNVMNILESDDYIKIDTSGMTHVISIKEYKKDETVLSKEERDEAAFVINAFANKSALELEALATMDYVANFILTPGSADSEIIAQFKEIKGSKFSENDIKKSLEELKHLGFVA